MNHILFYLSGGQETGNLFGVALDTHCAGIKKVDSV